MLFCAKIHLNPRQDASLLHQMCRCLVTAAAICLITATWPASAVASCGNYLFRHGKPVDDKSTAMNDHDDAGNHEQETNRPLGELPGPPCHGPNCSGHPVPLIPVPVAPTNLVRGFDQAAILESLAQTPMPRRAMEIPTSERGAHFVPSSVFRPPIV